MLGLYTEEMRFRRRKLINSVLRQELIN